MGTVVAESGTAPADVLPHLVVEAQRRAGDSEVVEKAVDWLNGDSSEGGYEHLAEVSQLLHRLAPSGYYFGTKPGEPENWGYWRVSGVPDPMDCLAGLVNEGDGSAIRICRVLGCWALVSFTEQVDGTRTSEVIVSHADWHEFVGLCQGFAQ